MTTVSRWLVSLKLGDAVFDLQNAPASRGLFWSIVVYQWGLRPRKSLLAALNTSLLEPRSPPSVRNWCKIVRRHRPQEELDENHILKSVKIERADPVQEGTQWEMWAGSYWNVSLPIDLLKKVAAGDSFPGFWLFQTNCAQCGWNNNKPPIWEWSIPPFYGDLGDDLLLFYWHFFPKSAIGITRNKLDGSP